MATVSQLADFAFQLLCTGDLVQAEQVFHQVLQIDPDHADSHHLLGVVEYQRGRYEEAVRWITKAICLNPDVGYFHTNLGLAHEGLGKISEAVAIHQRALLLRGEDAEAYYNLGTALLQQKRFSEAENHLRVALKLRPTYAEAHSNLGLALVDQGKRQEAIEHYHEALRLNPDCAEAYNNLGFALHELSLEAVASYQQALRLRPDYADAHTNLGLALTDQGKLSEAQTHFEAALRLLPSDKIQVAVATLLPVIYQSAEELLDWRRQLLENVHRLHDEGLRINVTDDPALYSFYPAYQGMNDRDLQRDLAALYVPPAEPNNSEVTYSEQAGEKIRIGFISRFFKDHTIGRLMKGLIAQLSRERFRVIVLSLGHQNDAEAQWIRHHADEYVELTARLPKDRQTILGRRIDVLFFTDIGMEAITYTLAMSRLAPVQCVTWGHPVTTGIPTMDYFISSEALESEESDEHYTERLVRLKNPAIYYYRPSAPPTLKSRDHFSLPKSGALYVCAQSLFKIHPDYDEILGGILRRDPSGTLVLLQGKYPFWEQLLRQRFAVSMPDVLDRVLFLPQQGHGDFMALNALADVLLDPIHFGGGNTSYEAFSLSVPIVTMPSKILRGRITYALYKQMGVMDCVVSRPQEYIDLAVKLGTDAEYRAAVSAEIQAASGVLFENPAGVRELEEFLQKAVTDHFRPEDGRA